MNVYLYVAGPKTMRTVLYYLYQMAAYIRKLFMSSASSAIGTGTVLGIHSAMAPAAPSIQGSDIRDAKVDDSKNLMKFDLDGGFVVLHDCVDDTHLPGGDSSNANVLLWVLTIQTTPEEEGGEMEVGISTDDGTAEQAGCRGGGRRSIVGKGTY